MNISRIKFIATAGVGLWAVTLALMSITINRTDLQGIRDFGGAIFIAGLIPTSYIFHLHPGKAPKNQLMAIYVSIYYSMVGMLSGYIGHRFGKDLGERIGIYVASIGGVFFFFLFFVFIIFGLTSGES